MSQEKNKKNLIKKLWQTISLEYKIQNRGLDYHENTKLKSV